MFLEEGMMNKSNKPSWDDAPAGARILVQSETGNFNFGSFNNAYVVDDEGWIGTGKGQWFTTIHGFSNPDWRNTLEYRPTVKESLTVDTKINHVTTTNLSEELDSMSINKYNKQCKGITIDVYDVLKAFDVTCPAMQHSIKKCLMAGKRGAKDAAQDMNEAIQSIERSKELLDQ
jgi:ribosomal protein L33